MKNKAAAVVAVVALTALAGCGNAKATTSGGITTLTFATASAAPTPLFENIYIAEQLGYYKAEGLDVKFVNTGGNAQVTTQIAQGRSQVGVGVPNFQVLAKSKGQALPGINYFEYTYPSKWSLVVPPNSPITSIDQLAGKKVGITSLGTADQQVMDALLTQHKVDPKSVKYQAVGETNAGGVALNKGQLDASLVWDTTLGAYDVAGIKYKVLLGPADMQKVGGFFVQAKPSWIKSDQAQAVGFARAVAKATVFALANPQAAASLYLQMYPSAATKETKAQQIADVVKTVKYRAVRWTPYTDPATLGFVQPQEFVNELQFAGVQSKVSDPAQFYDNSLIPQINQFDKAAIQAQAKSYQIPQS
jgi:NitT/TauT family transport system substrate-binding protein